MDASAELVKCLLPSVVHIHTEVSDAHPSAPILGTERMGSGTVVDPSGLILTVNYVVMGAEKIQVSLGQGRRLKAEIVAQDFDVGLALLRVKRQGLMAARFGSSGSVERGAPVLVIASTGPQERRVSGGVVTYLGEFEAYWEYLLDRGIVSSAVNPGFGGGPLFTLTGRMLGVVYLNLNEIIRNSLAIPVEFYREHEGELLRYGRLVTRPKRAWLGVFAHPLEEGVVVAGLVPDGPGERSGLREGDVIVSLNSEEVPTRKDLYLSLWRHSPGERIRLEILRDNVLKRIEVTSGDRADFYKQL
ncbi:MAG: serine protease [Candidatus Rokubacteria bacterium]|nr:serine protease [Candidatus Rokubacteria bacterium]